MGGEERGEEKREGEVVESRTRTRRLGSLYFLFRGEFSFDSVLSSREVEKEARERFLENREGIWSLESENETENENENGKRERERSFGSDLSCGGQEVIV